MLEEVTAEFALRGDRFLERVARAYFAEVLRRLGETDAAEEQARRVIAEGPMDPAAGVLARATLAEVLMGRGAHAGALEAILPAIDSEARRSGSLSRWAYRAVVAGWVCPSSFPMIGSPKPPPAPMLAYVWRRS